MWMEDRVCNPATEASTKRPNKVVQNICAARDARGLRDHRFRSTLLAAPTHSSSTSTWRVPSVTGETLW